MHDSSASSASSFIETPMNSTILLQDLREGDCYCRSVSSQSEIIEDLMPAPLSRSHSGIPDDLMPKPLSVRRQKPKKEQGMLSRLTTKNLITLTQEKKLQHQPPHPTDRQNQWNFYLHDKQPKQNPVVLVSLQHVPLHLVSDHGEELTSIHRCCYLDQAKAEKVSEWVEYPAPAQQELMPHSAGHDVLDIQATLRAVLGERYEPLDSFVEESLQMVAMGDDSTS